MRSQACLELLLAVQHLSYENTFTSPSILRHPPNEPELLSSLSLCDDKLDLAAAATKLRLSHAQALVSLSASSSLDSSG
jgi:hypothetical protein